MKPKGISFFEQHVEKIVIGLAAIVVLGIAVRQFFMPINAVTLNDQALAPNKVDAQLKTKAGRLEASLETSLGLFENEMDRTKTLGGSLSDWFTEQHSKPVVPTNELATALVRPESIKLGGAAVNLAAGKFAEFRPPAPQSLEVHSRTYSLDDSAVATIEGLSKIVTSQPPYDLAAVLVRATTSGKSLRDSLVRPAPEGTRNIPPAWFEDGMAILDVEAERQRRMADGSWSEAEVVPTIPGQATVRERLANAKSGDLAGILSDVATAGTEIYQPTFYPLIGGEAWSIDIIKQSEPMDPELEQADRRLQKSWKDLTDAQERLKRYDEQKERSTGTGGVTDTKGRENVGEQGSSNPTDRSDAMRDRLAKRVTDAGDEYDDAKRDVLKLDPKHKLPDATGALPGGMTNPGSPGPDERRGTGPEDVMPPDPGSGKRRGFEDSPEQGPELGRGTMNQATNRRARLFDQDKIELWVHDIAIRPGDTYRYRLRVLYYNPFFGRDDRLAPEQATLASSVSTASATTDWSAPVRVASALQYFATEARAGATVDERSATFEVYYFTGGEQRTTTLTVRPGEPIGERKVVAGASGRGIEVNFFTGAVLLDVIEVGRATGSLQARAQVVVAMSDGSVVTLDPETEKNSAERARLREAAARSAKP